MKTQDYDKISFSDFEGLFKRGTADTVPPDHACCCENVTFSRKDEVQTRNGTKICLATAYPIKRMRLATFDDNTIIPILLDYSGNIYIGDDPVPAFTEATMTDFSSLNLFNKFYLLPICLGNPSPPNLQVLPTAVGTFRDAAGLRPASQVTAVDGIADPTGGLDPGIHKFTVAYETDTGFITVPADTPEEYTAPGGLKVDLSTIPTGGAEVVKRHILVTRGNENLFFFAPGGTINDNVTTTATLNFFDSDLLVSADYLFDLLETIPGASGPAQLQEFHGRMLSTAQGDLVRVSRSGDVESFNNVDGFIQIPSQNDGNMARAICDLRDTLYIMKSVGVYSTEDNGSEPSSWHVTQIDGSVGCFPNALSSITGSQPALPTNEFFFLASRGGLYTFDGSVPIRPLTWKVDDIWQMITPGSEYNIEIVTDPFKQLIIMVLPTNGSTVPNMMLVGDYSDGLSWESIKWALWFFPFLPSCISMMNFLDDDGPSDYNYYLRIGSSDTNGMIKMTPNLTTDLGETITSYYLTALRPIQQGAMNVFRLLRFRARGSGNLDLRLYPEDMQSYSEPPDISLSAFPGKELDRQINFNGEKLAVYFGGTGSWVVNRLDVFGKPLTLARPS